MSFFGSMNTSVSGLSAQRLRLDIISQNIANKDTTRTEKGGPYKRKAVIFESVQNTPTFDTVLGKYQQGENNGVRVSQIVEDNKPFISVYNPTHPDADVNGYLQMPNVNEVEEMVNMISASRAYEANVTAFNNMKAMATKALEIGK